MRACRDQMPTSATAAAAAAVVAAAAVASTASTAAAERTAAGSSVDSPSSHSNGRKSSSSRKSISSASKKGSDSRRISSTSLTHDADAGDQREGQRAAVRKASSTSLTHDADAGDQREGQRAAVRKVSATQATVASVSATAAAPDISNGSSSSRNSNGSRSSATYGTSVHSTSPDKDSNKSRKTSVVSNGRRSGSVDSSGDGSAQPENRRRGIYDFEWDDDDSDDKNSQSQSSGKQHGSSKINSGCSNGNGNGKTNSSSSGSNSRSSSKYDNNKVSSSSSNNNNSPRTRHSGNGVARHSTSTVSQNITLSQNTPSPQRHSGKSVGTQEPSESPLRPVTSSSSRRGVRETKRFKEEAEGEEINAAQDVTQAEAAAVEEKELEASTPSSSSFAASCRSASPLPPGVELYQAVYLYDDESEEYLSIKKGDIMRITSKDPSGWWMAELDGRQGMVPGNYLAPYTPPDSAVNCSPGDNNNEEEESAPSQPGAATAAVAAAAPAAVPAAKSASSGASPMKKKKRLLIQNVQPTAATAPAASSPLRHETKMPTESTKIPTESTSTSIDRGSTFPTSTLSASGSDEIRGSSRHSQARESLAREGEMLEGDGDDEDTATYEMCELTTEAYPCCWQGCSSIFQAAEAACDHVLFHYRFEDKTRGQKFCCRWHNCSLLGRRLKWDQLVKHVRSSHIPSKRDVVATKCPECMELFTSPFQMRVHQEEIHPDSLMDIELTFHASGRRKRAAPRQASPSTASPKRRARRQRNRSSGGHVDGAVEAVAEEEEECDLSDDELVPCKHIAFLEPEASVAGSKLSGTCAVCQTSFSRGVPCMRCGAVFHGGCGSVPTRKHGSRRFLTWQCESCTALERRQPPDDNFDILSILPPTFCLLGGREVAARLHIPDNGDEDVSFWRLGSHQHTRI